MVDGTAVGMVYAKARNTDDLGYARDHSGLADAVATLQRGDRSPIASGECAVTRTRSPRNDP